MTYREELENLLAENPPSMLAKSMLPLDQIMELFFRAMDDVDRIKAKMEALENG